jgi:hypothetical protein
MASQQIWIGIVIAAFFVGLGSTYLIFHTGSSDVNENFNMMMNDPEMQKMIMTTMQDSNQIQLMEDMMADMMKRMQTDPELKQAMMEHMATMKSSRDAMMENMDNQTMNDMMEMNP